jgi:hypothetical protein
MSVNDEPAATDDAFMHVHSLTTAEIAKFPTRGQRRLDHLNRHRLATPGMTYAAYVKGYCLNVATRVDIIVSGDESLTCNRLTNPWSPDNRCLAVRGSAFCAQLGGPAMPGTARRAGSRPGAR